MIRSKSIRRLITSPKSFYMVHRCDRSETSKTRPSTVRSRISNQVSSSQPQKTRAVEYVCAPNKTWAATNKYIFIYLYDSLRSEMVPEETTSRMQQTKWDVLAGEWLIQGVCVFQMSQLFIIVLFIFFSKKISWLIF